MSAIFLLVFDFSTSQRFDTLLCPTMGFALFGFSLSEMAAVCPIIQPRFDSQYQLF